jgi:membrane-associated phospholipid phosphatase
MDRVIQRAIRIVLLLAFCFVGAGTEAWAAPLPSNGPVEPQAGTWKTWVLTSGSQLRLPAPPDAAATQAELAQLRALATQRDAAALEKVAYWDLGAPTMRWNQLAIDESLKAGLNARGVRAMALLDVAMYDATVAAWDSKYTYNRQRPAEFDPSLTTLVATPRSPSYPSEHAVTAGAAVAVLSYLFPSDASFFEQQATEATTSRLVAGVQYPSDVTAGLELGRAVGALVVARAKSDGSDAKWNGVMPTGPGHWTGQNPIEPTMGAWQTWVLSSGSQLRPPPPPAYDSPQEAADMAELRSYKRTPQWTTAAFYWQFADAGTNAYQFWNDLITPKISQYHLDDNPPRAARALALLYTTEYDAFVACWDGKYTYWAIRPFQLDPTFKTMFPTPNHPSYPAAHGCASGAFGAVLGYLFPSDAARFTAMANEAGESRIAAGIHFRTDVTVGLGLGRAVANLAIDRAKHDGSQNALVAGLGPSTASTPAILNGTIVGVLAGSHAGAFNYYQIANPNGAAQAISLSYGPYDAAQANTVGLNVYQNGAQLGGGTGQATITVTPSASGGPVLVQVFNYGNSTVTYTLTGS